MPVFIAIALTVVVEFITKGAEYVYPAEDEGAVPSSVYLTVAPAVAHVITTSWVVTKSPAGNLNTAIAATPNFVYTASATTESAMPAFTAIALTTAPAVNLNGAL